MSAGQVTTDMVRKYMGTNAPEEKLSAALAVVDAMVRAYTRGNGFPNSVTVEEPLQAVIVSATARLVGNVTFMEYSQAGQFSHRPGTFDGWTLPELAILHLYRRRTA